jgi:hypothetical protein
MTTTVRHTKTGNGALIIVHESAAARRARQNRRRARAVESASSMQFTSGQLAVLRRKRATR